MPKPAKTPTNRTWFSIKNEASAPAAEISIYDVIGSYGVNTRMFADALASIPKDRPILCMISSPGGEVSHGIAIYNLLKDRSDKVTTKVIGLAASSATLPFLSGSKRIMPKGSMLMVHMPMGDAFDATSDQMRKTADIVDKFKDAIVGVYADATGMDPEELEELMDPGTWMDPEEALEYGFATDIGEEVPVKNRYDLGRFSDVPKNVMKRFGLKAGVTNQAQPAADQQTTPTPEKSMNRIIAALVALGIATPADATEEQLAQTITNRVTALKNEVDGLKTENQKHKDAAKNRIEARVKNAIEAKKIKPEREASLVAMGIADEANLDFLDDLPTPGETNGKDKTATTVRGRATQGTDPLPADPGKGGSDDPEERMVEIKNKMKTERDPVKVAALARELTKLRGGSAVVENKVTFHPALR